MQKLLEILQLLFSRKGRIPRRIYWFVSVALIAVFLLALPTIESILGRWGTVIAYLPIYWSGFALMSKRCHDIGRSSWWLLLLTIPIVGVIWAGLVLGFRRGDNGGNQYGPDPRPQPPAYLVVEAVQ